MSHRFKFCPQCAQPLETRAEGERARPACPDKTCGYVLWENPTPVVAAVVEHEGKIILAQNRAWPQKFFALITGFLEKNERPDEAVMREVHEELNLRAHAPTLIGHYTFERMNQLIIAYHVRAEGTVKLGEELVDYRAIEPAKLKPWPAATGLALRDWMISRGHKPPLSLDDILNFRALGVGGRIGTAGQPAEYQFEAIRNGGYETVINLAMPTSLGALPHEAQLVAQHGMSYTHIPVVWEEPTAQDLEKFFAAMDAHENRRVFVHCALNKRVSVFVYLYRVLRLKEPEDLARKDLLKIWEPEPHWQRFIEQSLANG